MRGETLCILGLHYPSKACTSLETLLQHSKSPFPIWEKCSYFCILLQGLWQGLVKFKLCVGLLRNSLMLEVISSLWDKAHGGSGRWKAGLDLCREDEDEMGQLLEVAPFSQECAGWGIFLFSVPEGISKVQMAGASLPMHLFPLISSQGRETPKNQTPSKLLKVGEERGVLGREELAACELVLLSAAHFGLAHFWSLWLLCTRWWLSREALPQFRRETFSALGAVRWWHAPAVRLEEGDTEQLGTPNPGHFGVFLLCCWRCKFSA